MLLNLSRNLMLRTKFLAIRGLNILRQRVYIRFLKRHLKYLCYHLPGWVTLLLVFDTVTKGRPPLITISSKRMVSQWRSRYREITPSFSGLSTCLSKHLTVLKYFSVSIVGIAQSFERLLALTLMIMLLIFIFTSYEIVQMSSKHCSICAIQFWTS